MPNAGFEQAAAGGKPLDWFIDPPPRAQSATTIDSKARSGARSLEIVNTSGNNSVLVRSTKLPANAGAHFEAAAHIRAEQGDPAWLYLEFWDQAGTRISEQHIETPTPSANACKMWKRVSIDGTAPGGTVSVSVTLYGSHFDVGSSQIDDVELWSFDELAVPNASFEQAGSGGKPLDWFIDPPPRAQSATTTDSRARSGARSLEIVNPPGSTVGPLVRSTKLPANAGARFEAVAHMWAEQGDPAWLYLEFWDQAGTRISEQHFETPQPSAQEWKRVSIGGTAPAGTVSVSVTLYGHIAGAGTSQVDDVELWLIDELGLIDGPAYDPYIGRQKQLFHDDLRIAASENVTREVNVAEKRATPVLVADKPWESTDVYLYGTVIYDEEDQIFKIWYHSWDYSQGNFHTMYATSSDGLNWTKPNLGVFTYNGSTNNNIVGTMHSPTVIKDNADPDPARRYKMFSAHLAGAVWNSGYLVFFSPDGIHWTPSPNNPVIADGDVSNVFYDPISDQFVVTSKHPHSTGRAVFISCSDDFENWTAPQLILAADAQDQQIAQSHGRDGADIYGMPVIPYEGGYVGFPWVFEHSTTFDPIDVQMAFSSDGLTWERPDRQPVIPRGGSGAFDDSMIFTAGNVIVRDGRIWMYYGGFDEPHLATARNGAIGLASWPEDGFVSLANKGVQGGSVTTQPLVFEGSELHVNADFAGPGSELRVEVLDVEGNVISGFEAQRSIPLQGDSRDTQVTWTNNPDLGNALAGQQVRLRFLLKGGDLYSYWFDTRS